MKVVLIDDENLALQNLEHELDLIEHMEINIIGKYTDPMAGKTFILEHDVDVVFMDINLPEINGIELAKQILERKPDIYVVFVSAYDHYAISAFDLNAIDYILKPVRSGRLTKTLQRIEAHLSYQFIADTPEKTKKNKVSGKVVPNGKMPANLHEEVPVTKKVPATNEKPKLARKRTIRLKLFQHIAIEAKPGKFVLLRFRTSKAQELFLYLLQHRDKIVRKSFLIDLLWPEYEPDRAFSQLYTAVYHVRKSLDPFEAHFQLMNELDGYILILHNIKIDVEEWERKIVNGPLLSDQTIVHYEKYIQLFTGDYLQGFDYWWAESERHRLKQQWIRIASQLAEWYATNDYKEKAEQMYIEICSRHPYTEDAHFSLMKLYASMNDRQSVRRQFHTLQSILKEDLNEQPSACVQDWYREWEETS